MKMVRIGIVAVFLPTCAGDARRSFGCSSATTRTLTGSFSDIALVLGLNTLDSLQLAVALELPRKGLPAELVTADQVLLAVAPLEGLAVNNPEVPSTKTLR